MTINNLPFSNLAPYLTLTEGIVLNGIFPSRDGGDSGNTPVGAIRSFAFNYVPGGHLTASGQTLSVYQNTALFSILGTQYGGNGSSNFVLPDLTGRVSLGSGENGYVGEARGSTLTTLTRSEIPTGRGGGGQLVDNTQPELTLTYGIRVYGLYPSPGSSAAPGGLIGEIVQFAGNFTPSNGGAYLPADGRTVNISDYEALYGLIGTTYGGDGQYTFALPDLKGRNIVGSGAVSIDGSPYTVGQKFGASQIALSNANLPATVGGQGQPFSNEQPSLVLTYAIATTGIYPSRESGGGADADGDPYVGEVRAFALRPDQLPSGWHVADGATLPINQNQVLFSLLGTQYGGNGQTTFRLPDLQGRAVVSAGTSSDGGQTFTVGQSGGSRLVYLSDAQTPNFIAPVNTVPGAVNADLRDTVTFGSAQGTQISVQEGDNSTLSVSLSVLHGTLTLVDPTGISASGNGTTQLVLSGSTAAINTKLDGLVYRSTPGYAGQDTLTVRSTDSQLVDVDTVAITAQAAVPTVRGLISAATGPTNTSDLTYTLTFSENVSGVDPADFVLRRTDGTALSNVPASATSADGGTTWTVNIPVADVEGTVHLELKASGTGITDADGNPLPQGAIVGTSVTLDHLVPVVTGIVPITAGPTNAASLTQTVTFSEAVTGVDQSDFVLTQTGFATGAISAVTGSGTTYTVTINNLSGTGTLRLDLAGNGTGIVDAAGNAAPSYAAGTTVIVDRDAPSAPILASPANGSLTNNARPTVSGTAEANSSVTISIDGTAVGSTTASGAGAFSFVTPNALADGAHSFRAEATDAAGNVSPAAMRDIVVDATAPVAEVTSVAFSADSGSSSTDRITNVAAQTISGSLTGSLGAGEGVWVSLNNGGTYTLATTDGTGSWSLGNQTLVGSNTLKAKVIDGAGNAGPEYTVAYVLDTTAPTTTIGGIALSADTGTSATDFLTSVAAQTVSATLSAALAAGDSLYASANGGGSWTDITSRVSGTSVSWSGVTLATGSNELRFRVVDVAGNEGPTASRLYTLDTVAPTLNITSNVSQLKADESAAITFTFSEDPGATFTTADVTVSGGTLGSLTGSGSVRVATFTPTAGTDNGTASITVAAGSYADGAGNLGVAGSSPSITFDTLRPAASSAPVLAVGSDTGLSSTDGLTANNRPTITGSAEAGALVTLYDTDGTTVVGTGASVGGTYSITPSTALVDGEHQLTTKVTDAAGNVSAASSPLSVTVDTTAPTLAITSSASSLRIGETATLTFAFSEDPGATFTWDGQVGDVVVSGGTLSALSGAGRTRTAVFTPTAGVSAGTASITVAASSYVDAAGNLGGAGATPSLTFNTVVPPSDGGSPPVTAPESQTGGRSTSLTTTTDPVAAQAAASQAVQGLPASVDRTTAGQGIAAFLAGLPAGTSVNVSTFTPTPGASDIRIDGPTNGTQTIVILDASAVPPGTPITLNNVGFVVLSGPASLVGGDGSQVVFGDSNAQSMVLGADDDTLRGGGGNDVVGSKGGNDQLYGDAGDDTVFGGIGNDTLFGGTDQDFVYGNQDADLIYGNLGQDTLYGGQGDDRAFGGQGDDRVFGNTGNDVLYGNIGSDIVYGNQGADIVYGNQGNDVLFGGQGDDILYGGQGDDVLIGGLGSNTLVGGLGADRYLFGANPGSRDLILGFDQARGDRISLSGQAYTVSNAANGDALLILSGGGTVGLAGIRLEQINASFFN